MSTVSCILLLVSFGVAQFLFAKKVSHRIIRFIPTLTSVAVAALSVGLHIYAQITYSIGIASESVLAENQYFATFLLIPAAICLIGSVAGLLAERACANSREQRR